MTALISFLIAVTLSLLLTRVAAVALSLTGLSDEVARFQALSAFSGVGFTTSESEYIINHPVRRRIIAFVIRLGNVGIITVISSLVLTFVNTASSQEQTVRLLWLAAGISILFLLARSQWVDRHLSRLIQTLLERYTDLEAKDYASLLGIRDGYRVARIEIQPQSWLAQKTLAEANISAEGILILGIHRPDGNYVGAPQGDTRINRGDELVVYGEAETISQINKRLRGATGDQAHQQAMAEQGEYLQKQRAQDDRYSQYPDQPPHQE